MVLYGFFSRAQALQRGVLTYNVGKVSYSLTEISDKSLSDFKDAKVQVIAEESEYEFVVRTRYGNGRSINGVADLPRLDHYIDRIDIKVIEDSKN